MDAPLFRAEAVEARRRPAHGERLRLGTSGFTLAATAAAITLAALLAFAWVAELPRRATVRGYLAPDLGLARVHPATAGVVMRIEVVEGDEVSAGQPLVAVRDPTPGASRRDNVLRAPIAGRVAQLAVRQGDAVTPQRAVATVVPRGATLLAVLMIAPRDVGLVRPGQRAVLRVDAFPHRRYGALSARVREVPESASLPGELTVPLPTAEAWYRVLATLEPQATDGRIARQALRPDLSLDADIVLERAPLWTRLFEPAPDAADAGR